MSDYAVTPETYAAWRYLELNDELRPYDGERAEMDRREEELGLLLADLEETPTAEKLEIYFKRDLELQLFIQRSLARSLDRYKCHKICLADMEARPGAYPCFGTEGEIQRRVEDFQREDVELAKVAAHVEEGQSQYAEKENLLAAVNALIAKRRAREQFDGREPSISRT